MNNIQNAGTFAAFTNAVLALVTIYVATVLIGLKVLADRSLFIDMAINNPFPLVVQDVVKFLSAGCAAVLILVMHRRLSGAATKRVRMATLFGFLSILLLLSNAILSLTAITNAAELTNTNPLSAGDINLLIGILAMGAIITNGLWYLLISWTALKAALLPKGLNYIGQAIGTISLFPILGIIALVLSVVWSFWLGSTLSKEKSVV